MKSLRTTNKDFLASSATLRIDKYNHTSPWRRFLRMSLMFAYVCTWVTFYLLLHYTEMGASIGRVQQRHDDRSAISAVQVLSSIIFVICVEIIKILFSVRLYLMNGSPSAMAEFCELPVLKRLLIRYLPTAILYTIYNILMLLNLRSNAPTAYLIITSSRLVITAVAWKAFFKDGNVTPLRKLAIVIITLGIFTRGISGQEGASYARPWSYSGGQQPTQMISHSHHQITSVMLILFQVMCSVLAGIYNEKTLKNDTCSHHLHNICLYLDSIAVNVIVGLVIFAVNGGNDDGPIISHLQIENLLSPSAILIILTLSIAGIMSSLVLRYENSISKCIASASETICTSLLEFFWFGRSFKTTEWISIFLVSMGTVLYTKDSISWKVSTRKIVNLCLLLYIITLFLFFSLYPTHIDKGLGNMQYVKDFVRKQPEICMREAFFRPRPVDVAAETYYKVYKAQEVVKYLIAKLRTIGAPVSLIYGTLLHEYRNGTGPCVQPNLYDKDYDIALFEPHFHAVQAVSDEIKQIFDWEIHFINKKRLFMILTPAIRGEGLSGKPFQIDVYGFKCNNPRAGLIYFPWDKVIVSMDAFLPVVKHKTIAYDEVAPTNFRVSDDQLLYYHTPFNVPCLLANVYGRDFMTPKRGHFLQNNAYDNPLCGHRVLTSAEQQELDRQLSFIDERPKTILTGVFTFDENKKIERELQFLKNSTIGTPLTPANIYERSNLENNSFARMKKTVIISCVRSREDVVFALELANRFQEIQEKSSNKLILELYHASIISPFLVAKLELIRGVQVIQINNISNELKYCLSAALSITNLVDIIVVEPSLIFVNQTSEFWDKINAEKKMKMLPRGLNESFSSVMSTSASIDDALQFAKLQEGFRFHPVYSYESTVDKCDIFSVNGFQYVGSMHTGIFAFDFLYPHPDVIKWSTYHVTDQLFCQKNGSTLTTCPKEVAKRVEVSLRRYQYWLTVLLLDRQVGWVAFDGGLVNEDFNGCISFNSVEAAKRSARFSHSNEHKTILNIDLIMTSDKVNVAMHSEASFGPIDYGQKITRSPSTMTVTEVQKHLRNPCLSNEDMQKWFDVNSYRSHGACDKCSSGISSASAFITDIVLKDEVPIIFDLKSPDGKKQETQAQQILSFIRNASRSETDAQKLIENVGIRYFAVGNNGSIQMESLPSQLQKISMQGSPSSILNVYINAPSKEACLRLAQWTSDQGKRIGGCFVILSHAGVSTSFHNAERELNIRKTLQSIGEIKLICDVPREQAHPNTRLWKKGLVSCVEDGYDWIHHPFPVASEADYSVISNSMLASIIVDGNLIANKLQSFSVMQLRTHLRSKFQGYKSHWGVTSPYYWKPHQQEFSFVGNMQSTSMTSKNKGHVFRCATKILTVMLFLRFEEMGLLSIDDTIVTLANNVTWKQVFSNTAGIKGTHTEKKFEYSNSLWLHTKDFVEQITGVSFVEAIRYYVLDPMGLSGYFDVNTPYPPFSARGFIGSHKDLLLIGSTLASGGVSPETRIRVLSKSSVEKMLHDWTREQNVTASFMIDKTVKSMTRFSSGEHNDSFFSYGIVDGYGMGLWRVKGWRSRGNSSFPVRGWLSIGSSEVVLYFDEDSIVVGMCSQQRILGLELTAPFASIVREIGTRISNSFVSQGRQGS